MADDSLDDKGLVLELALPVPSDDCWYDYNLSLSPLKWGGCSRNGRSQMGLKDFWSFLQPLHFGSTNLWLLERSLTSVQSTSLKLQHTSAKNAFFREWFDLGFFAEGCTTCLFSLSESSRVLQACLWFLWRVKAGITIASASELSSSTSIAYRCPLSSAAGALLTKTVDCFSQHWKSYRWILWHISFSKSILPSSSDSKLDSNNSSCLSPFCDSESKSLSFFKTF